VTRFLRFRVALALVVVSTQFSASAQAPGVHPISGRRYALPMSVAGAPWLDRAERDQEESSERSVRLLNVTTGSVVADIGAGSGYYTERLARLVGPTGRVYASDIQAGMLELIRVRVEKARLSNVEMVLGTPTDPKLPPAAIDMALMVDVYHEFSDPQIMLRRIREALKPNGRLILLEYRAEDPRVPIRADHKMSVAQAKLEVEAEGFTLSTVNEELPWQHLFVFTKR
jgi:ubiquinone/menaquinone biosynthesis C-methylase UbiE